MLSRLPVVTKALLLANVVIFVLQLLLPEWVVAPLKLWPVAVNADPMSLSTSFMPWQLITHAFMHADLLHIAMNLLGLLMFGAELEAVWGRRRYIVFYAACALGAGLCQEVFATLVLIRTGEIYTSLGASGGVFGVMVGFAMMFPDRRVSLLFLPILIKARTLAVIFIALQLVQAFIGLNTGEAHFAHLGGALVGWLMIRRWSRPKPPQAPPPRKRSSHLRIVK